MTVNPMKNTPMRQDQPSKFINEANAAIISEKTLQGIRGRSFKKQSCNFGF